MKTWCSTCINAMVALAATALLAGCGPSTPEEYLAAARKELARNDRATAEIQLRNALQKNPDLGEARYLLGKTLLDNREPAAAEKELRRAAGLGYTSDQTYPALARAMLMLGQTKKLIEEFGTTKLASRCPT